MDVMDDIHLLWLTNECSWMNFFHQQQAIFSIWKYSYMAHDYLCWGRLWDVIHDKFRSLGTFYKITKTINAHTYLLSNVVHTNLTLLSLDQTWPRNVASLLDLVEEIDMFWKFIDASLLDILILISHPSQNNFHFKVFNVKIQMDPTYHNWNLHYAKIWHLWLGQIWLVTIF